MATFEIRNEQPAEEGATVAFCEIVVRFDANGEPREFKQNVCLPVEGREIAAQEYADNYEAEYVAALPEPEPPVEE